MIFGLILEVAGANDLINLNPTDGFIMISIKLKRHQIKRHQNNKLEVGLTKIVNNTFKSLNKQ